MAELVKLTMQQDANIKSNYMSISPVVHTNTSSIVALAIPGITYTLLADLEGY
jgi:hypothetical protein